MKLCKFFLKFLVSMAVVQLIVPNFAQAQATFIRGDINCDGVVDTVDLRLIRTSPPQSCTDMLDVNDDGVYGGSDTIYLENYLFFAGPPPPHPFPICGLDTTADFLDCQFNCCCTLTTQCNDAIDNDGDGLTDYPDDCGCSNSCDSTELPNPITECSDGIDNDGDGLIDLADPQCVNICDASEFYAPCSDFAGDANGSGILTLPDITWLVGHVFKGKSKPNPACRGDCNNTNTITLTDIIILVNHILKGGPKPQKDFDGPCCR